MSNAFAVNIGNTFKPRSGSFSQEAIDVAIATSNGVATKPGDRNPLIADAVNSASAKAGVFADVINIAISAGNGENIDISDVSDIAYKSLVASGNTDQASALMSASSILKRAVAGGEKIAVLELIDSSVSGMAGVSPGFFAGIGNTILGEKIEYRPILNQVVINQDTDKKRIAWIDITRRTEEGVSTKTLNYAEIIKSARIASGGNKVLEKEIVETAVKSVQLGKVDHKSFTKQAVQGGSGKKGDFYREAINVVETKNSTGKFPDLSGLGVSAVKAYGGKNSEIYAESLGVLIDYEESGEINVKKIANTFLKSTDAGSEGIALAQVVYDAVKDKKIDKHSLVGAIGDKLLGYDNPVDIGDIYLEIEQGITTGEWDKGAIADVTARSLGIKTEVDIYGIADELSSIVSTGEISGSAVAEIVENSLGVTLSEKNFDELASAVNNLDAWAATDEAIEIYAAELGIKIDNVDTEAIVDWAVEKWDNLDMSKPVTEIFSDLFPAGEFDYKGVVDGILGIESGDVGGLISYLQESDAYSGLLDGILGGGDLGGIGGLIGGKGLKDLMSAFGSSNDYAPPPCLDKDPPNTRMASDDFTAAEKQKTEGANWIEFSSHGKIVQMHLGDDNGEPAEYDVQFDRESGDFSIWNGGKQHIKYNLKKGKISIKSPKCVLIETEAFTVDAPNSYFTGNVKIYGHAKVLKTLNVKDDTLLEAQLTVEEETMLEDTLDVTKDTKLNADLHVADDTKMDGKLRVKKHVSFKKRLDVKGIAAFEDEVHSFKKTLLIGETKVASAISIANGGEIAAAIAAKVVALADDVADEVASASLIDQVKNLALGAVEDVVSGDLLGAVEGLSDGLVDVATDFSESAIDAVEGIADGGLGLAYSAYEATESAAIKALEGFK